MTSRVFLAVTSLLLLLLIFYFDLASKLKEHIFTNLTN